LLGGHWTTSLYGVDGHGSVRFLMNPSGAITDTYDYDAFGILIHQTGSTPNVYLYCGEQYDADLGFYYNRARYLNSLTGRFITKDLQEGDPEEPDSQHAYLYAQANPVNRTDPSGFASVLNWIYGNEVHDKIGEHFLRNGLIYGEGYYNRTINTILGLPVAQGSLRPDLVQKGNIVGEVYEIKGAGSLPIAEAKLAIYVGVLNRRDPKGRIWIPGLLYTPPLTLQLRPTVTAFVLKGPPGIILYDVTDWRLVLAALAAYAIYEMAVLTTQIVLANTTAASGAP
jgi:RHS repeat-associated protein